MAPFEESPQALYPMCLLLMKSVVGKEHQARHCK